MQKGCGKPMKTLKTMRMRPAASPSIVYLTITFVTAEVALR